MLFDGFPLCKFSHVLSDIISASAIGNLASICLGVNNLWGGVKYGGRHFPWIVIS